MDPARPGYGAGPVLPPTMPTGAAPEPGRECTTRNGAELTSPVLAGFRAAVEANYQHARSVTEYARITGYSRRTLGRVVRASTGKTPKQ